MAHRGRLSVLAHNLGRSLESIMAEFEGAKAIDAVKRSPRSPTAGTGDVKYHHGAEGMFETREGDRSRCGCTRTRATSSSSTRSSPAAPAPPRPSTPARGCTTTRSVAVPLLLHGDAAFPGQGVVAETLNLQSLDGYSTGGTIHIITDNQVGFTTDPQEGRSTPYAADMAKGFNVPIIHVNADDVEACVAAVRLAMAYREKWGRDVVIDLIGYRRYGHNETDEPAYTQPQMAAQIKKHPPVSELYAEQLIDEGVVTDEDVAEDARASAARSSGDATRSCGRRSSAASSRTRARPHRHRRARPDQEPRGRDQGLREARSARSTRSCCGSRRASRSTASCASRC